MKQCTRCGLEVVNRVSICPRCTGTNFVTGANETKCGYGDSARERSRISMNHISKNQSTLPHSPNRDKKETASYLLQTHADFTHIIRVLKDLNEYPDSLREAEHARDSLEDLFDKERALRKNESSVHVAVIGKFSAGKSSFINSLLGQDICPTANEMTTSAVTRFCYSDEERFSLMNEEWQELRPLSKDEYKARSRHGDSESQSRNRSKNEFWFECRFPAEELRSVILYDSPGFNNPHTERGKQDTELTEKMLNSVDVVLFLVDINTPSVGADMLPKLEKLHREKKILYLILNKADQKAPSVLPKILNSCMNEAPLFRKGLCYSAKEEREEGKPLFVQEDSAKEDSAKQVFAMTEDKKGFALTMAADQADAGFAKRFDSAVRGKRERLFIFANINDGTSTPKLRLVRAEPAKRTETRQEVSKWFQDIRKEKERIAQTNFFQQLGAWHDKAKNCLHQLERALEADIVSDEIKDESASDIQMVFDEFSAYVQENAELWRDRVERTFINALRSNIYNKKSDKEYLFSPYWELNISEHGCDDIISKLHECIKSVFEEISREFASLIPSYMENHAEYLRQNPCGHLSIEESDMVDLVLIPFFNSALWQGYASNFGEHYDDKSEAGIGKTLLLEAVSQDAGDFITPLMKQLYADCQRLYNDFHTSWDKLDGMIDVDIKHENERLKTLLTHVREVLERIEHIPG